MSVIGELDLATAWKRLKQDRPDRTFVCDPHLLGLIEDDLLAGLETIRSRLETGFAGQDCKVCYAPKPNWLVRPAGVLHPQDELVYNAILGQFHPAVWEKVKWSQGDPDMGYRLAQPSNAPLWVKNDSHTWVEFRVKSLA